MSSELYNTQIMTWAGNTAHLKSLAGANYSGEANNPLCGDKISVEMLIEGGVVADVAISIKGCILSKASAAHFAENARGKTTAWIEDMHREFAKALRDKTGEVPFPELLVFFTPVKSRRSRHGCLLLPWEAALKALKAGG